jgi:hypothetical protein
MKQFLLIILTITGISTGTLFAAPGVTASSTSPITLPASTTTIAGAISGFQSTGSGSSLVTYSAITYTWTVTPALDLTNDNGSLTQNASGNASVSGPTVTFAPDVNTTYTFKLTINYKKKTGTGSAITQTALTTTTQVVVNVPLVAVAGTDVTLTLSGGSASTNVTLTGTASGGTGSYTYAWSKVSGPSGGTTNANSQTANISGLQIGAYVYKLTVNGTATDQVTVTVLAPPSELVFKNPSLDSGLAGQDNAVYRFRNITNKTTAEVDALVKITGRSSTAVVIAKDNSNNYIIDETGTGYDNAFQPRVDYTGSYNSSTDWYLEFQVTLVKAGTKLPVTVNSFGLSGLDLDGNSTYHEYVSLYGLSTYTVEQNSDVTASALANHTGERFDGSHNEYDGIDVGQTNDEFTANFVNANAFIIRVGGKVTNGSGTDLGIDNGRQYSLWFKSLDFTAPVQSGLPITLSAFTVNKSGNDAILKWTTESELNNDYMLVERSSDGVNFTNVATIQGNGTTELQHNYQYADPINGLTGVVYYRLRDVDLDGKGNNSKVIALRLDGSVMSASLSVYPNPFVSNVKLSVNASKEGRANVVISNIAGQQVANESVLLQNGQNIIVLQNLSALTPGIYAIDFTTQEGRFSQKIIKN